MRSMPAAAWLVTEKFSDEEARLPKDGSTLVAPELVFAEVAKALRRRGGISGEDVVAADALKAAPPLLHAPAHGRRRARPGHLPPDL